MNTFLVGFVSSLAATAVFTVLAKTAWPIFIDRIYKGIRVAGSWEIIENRERKKTKVGLLELKQAGRRITGKSVRVKRRDGKKSNRKFKCKGYIDGDQVTLLFEDKHGVAFDTGSYVFIVQNDGLTMIGMATFHGKVENQIVAEQRTLQKVAS